MSSTSAKLTGKRALVTGAGTGIGREIALELARQGADIALHHFREESGANTAAALVQSLGRRAAVFQADFRNLSEVQRLAEQASDFLAGLDCLVNNAGITTNIPFEKVTPEQFDVLYQVNVRASFFLTQRLLPSLVASRGVVINLTSIHAFEGMPQHTIYAGTKGALVAYTRTLAVELALKGVRVNAIAPGCVYVESYDQATGGFDPEAAGRLIPAGFVGRPADIARVAAFLASDDARFIVGQTLIVDGGTVAWMPFSDEFRQPITAQFGKGYVPGL